MPVFAAAIVFYAKVDDAAKIALLIWYGCMNVTFFIFCGLAIYHEIKLCLDLTRIVYGNNGDENNDVRGLSLMKEALMTTLTHRYAGRKQQVYVVDTPVDDFDPNKSQGKAPAFTYTGIYSRSTLIRWNPFFIPLDPPQRCYSFEEIREMVPYVTNKTWSLEKMCCSLGNGRR